MALILQHSSHSNLSPVFFFWQEWACVCGWVRPCPQDEGRESLPRDWLLAAEFVYARNTKDTIKIFLSMSKRPFFLISWKSLMFEVLCLVFVLEAGRQTYLPHKQQTSIKEGKKKCNKISKQHEHIMNMVHCLWLMFLTQPVTAAQFPHLSREKNLVVNSLPMIFWKCGYQRSPSELRFMCLFKVQMNPLPSHMCWCHNNVHSGFC